MRSITRGRTGWWTWTRDAQDNRRGEKITLSCGNVCRDSNSLVPTIDRSIDERSLEIGDEASRAGVGPGTRTVR